ncbi:MAG: OsmC family protein [Microthrixaceae bacterium]|nr:OsmC family protein [Microthrixaceae bacterium]
MTDRPGASYTVTAGTNGDGTSTALANGQAVRFDSAPGQGDELPGPADLLTAAFAACVLKNVERMGDLLPFGWESASIEVTSHRQDHPPKMTRISYRLEVVTDEPDQRVELLHRNISRHGTIYNTLADACDVAGEVVAVRPS